SAGNEYNPMDDLGRVELTIEPDGRAHLVHHEIGRRTQSRGTVDAASLDRLREALERAGFPRVRDHEIVPDALLCTLPLDAGSGPGALVCPPGVDGQSVRVDRPAPQYGGAFTILDSVVAELSE